MKQLRSSGKLNEQIISKGGKKPMSEKNLTKNM
jgi:hypothetical protein